MGLFGDLGQDPNDPVGQSVGPGPIPTGAPAGPLPDSLPPVEQPAPQGLLDRVLHTPEAYRGLLAPADIAQAKRAAFANASEAAGAPDPAFGGRAASPLMALTHAANALQPGFAASEQGSIQAAQTGIQIQRARAIMANRAQQAQILSNVDPNMSPSDRVNLYARLGAMAAAAGDTETSDALAKIQVGSHLVRGEEPTVVKTGDQVHVIDRYTGQITTLNVGVSPDVAAKDQNNLAGLKVRGDTSRAVAQIHAAMQKANGGKPLVPGTPAAQRALQMSSDKYVAAAGPQRPDETDDEYAARVEAFASHDPNAPRYVDLGFSHTDIVAAIARQKAVLGNLNLKALGIESLNPTSEATEGVPLGTAPSAANLAKGAKALVQATRSGGGAGAAGTARVAAQQATLSKQANDAIAAGADPDKVNARLAAQIKALQP